MRRGAINEVAASFKTPHERDREASRTQTGIWSALARSPSGGCMMLKYQYSRNINEDVPRCCDTKSGSTRECKTKMWPYSYLLLFPAFLLPHFPSSIFISPFKLSFSLLCSNPLVLPLRPKVELEIDIRHSVISYSIQLLIQPGGEKKERQKETEIQYKMKSKPEQ